MPFLIMVHDDGDAEIRRCSEIPPYNYCLACPDEESLRTELESYGFEDDRIADVLAETAKTNEWVQV